MAPTGHASIRPGVVYRLPREHVPTVDGEFRHQTNVPRESALVQFRTLIDVALEARATALAFRSQHQAENVPHRPTKRQGPSCGFPARAHR